MMDYPLSLQSFVTRAEQLFPTNPIVSRTADGLFRYTYREYAGRVRQLANALSRLGVAPGDRVGTLAWNHHRHLEAYLAIPAMGSVIHTVNLRLSPDHLTYIINHAEDKVILVDQSLLPLVAAIHDRLQTVSAVVVMGDNTPLPPTTFPILDYEALLAAESDAFSYPAIDERQPAGLCYTSATTGNPKGVLYSHRGIYLHSMSLGLADSAALSEQDVAMPVVPMFHANAWGMPFAAVWFGTPQVLPGPAPTPADLVDLMVGENVTLAAGVPTVWLGVLRELDARQSPPPPLRAILCGGSAAPRALIQAYEERYRIPFVHAYGMTETAPLASIARLKRAHRDLSPAEKLNVRALQGMAVPGMEIRVVGLNGDVAWDGQEMGEILMRGPWVADSYYHDDRSQEAFQDGWLHSGDIATINAEGYLRLVDRTKDLVKSGGEWISSVDLENMLMAHQAVFEACVVGLPHPRWDERPVAFVVPQDPAHPPAKADLLDSLRPHFAKWWIPDDVVFITEIPKTSVGKFLKRALREEYAEHLRGAT
ncbi:MAG: long-chain fatty acid--CoA ligase [Thermaerobacter sp.]|nr:long-chain fatty acid--CoA ligase [Thermaerobacter sp.]